MALGSACEGVSMHVWGEKGVDWKGIDAAASYIRGFCRRYGRLGGSSKEKYGTVRFYAMFGELSLHGLTHPGYYYNQFPKWLWKLDCKYISPTLEKLFGRPFRAWQRFVYSTAYNRAVKKWPHLAAEILTDCDYPEYIKGCHRKEGSSTHIIHPQTGEILCTWTRVGH